MKTFNLFFVNSLNVIFMIIQNAKKNTEELKGQMIQCHNNRMNFKSVTQLCM